ncbi:DNA mismatch repair protein MutS [Pancytospora epiphaga]|nr:DNA mismatch repair protein MutS [Pancytospora epiphaga]
MHECFACVLYNNEIFGMCMFDQMKYTVYHPMVDTQSCAVSKEILSSNSVAACLLQSNLESKRLECIKQTNIECILVEPASYKDYISESPYVLSTRCLYVLGRHLNHKNFELSEEPLFLGHLNTFPVYVVDPGYSVYMTSETLSTLMICSGRDDGNDMANPGIRHHVKKTNTDKTLFDKIDRTITVAGRNKLRLWLAFPLRTCEDIQKRHRLQEIFRPLLPLLVVKLRKCRCGDIYNISNMSSVHELLKAVFDIHQILRGSLKLENKRAYLNLIQRLKAYQNGRIVDGYDPKIDQLRRLLRDLPARLNQIAKDTANSKNVILSVVYFPQLGYLIETRDLCEDVVFSINGKNYYKTSEMRGLDRTLGDIETSLYNRVSWVINDIVREIQQTDFSYLTDFIGTVDVICAMALFSEQHACVPPIFSDSFEFIDIGSRVISPGSQRGKLLNENSIWNVKNIYFGKRCILPEGASILVDIGQIVIMGLAGYYLPYTVVRIPLFCSIIIKPRKKGFEKERVSSFYAEVMAMKEILMLYRLNSLCLIDDPGRGTTPADGISLFMAFSESIDAKVYLATTNHNFTNLSLETGNTMLSSVISRFIVLFSIYHYSPLGNEIVLKASEEEESEFSKYSFISPTFLTRLKQNALKLKERQELISKNSEQFYDTQSLD